LKAGFAPKNNHPGKRTNLVEFPAESLDNVPVGCVAVVRCADYEQARVDEAVARGIKLLGGMHAFARPGEHILLKPNMLSAHAPEKVVTTHPSVFGAMIRQLQEAGARVSYGDSPGFHKPETVAKKSGLMQVAQELSVPMADFVSGEQVSFADGKFIKQFTLAKGIGEADGVISLPKLKTHALTRITGAIKNQFGCIPGLLKGEFHARLSDAERFTQMLVDLNRLVAPRLFVMDAIIAMEGNGPGSGDPRPLGALLFSTDPVALDAAACRLIALEPALVPTNRIGQEMGLGRYDKINLVGDPIDGMINKEFNVKRGGTTKNPMNNFLASILRQRLVPRPVIEEKRCSKCGTCVKLCPAKPKAIDFKKGKKQPPVYDYDACIRCYCCQEMCPEKAIVVKTPLLGRVLHGRV
jgi:uncharacterized protein (DUF362 family)/ferredoxin